MRDNLKEYRFFSWFLFCALICFFLYIFHDQPWTIDILQFWQKHLQGFSEIFAYSIHYGNGRLLGNIGTFYLIYYPTIGLIIRVSFLAALPFLICRALDIKSKIINVIVLPDYLNDDNSKKTIYPAELTVNDISNKVLNPGDQTTLKVTVTYKKTSSENNLLINVPCQISILTKSV